MTEDFHKRFAAARRSRDRMSTVVTIWIALIWLAMTSAIVFCGYTLLTTSPEEMGAFFGRIVAGFEGAS